VVEDQQAQMGLLALMQNMDKYRQMRGAIQNQSAGDAAFGQREARDAAVQWQDFTGQLQRMAIVVGTRLLPQFQPFLATVTTMMDRAGQWADANPRLASSLASLAGGIVVARVGLLQFAFGSILGPVGLVSQGWARRPVSSPACRPAFPLPAPTRSRFGALGHQSIGAFLGFKALIGDLGRMGLGWPMREKPQSSPGRASPLRRARGGHGRALGRGASGRLWRGTASGWPGSHGHGVELPARGVDDAGQPDGSGHCRHRRGHRRAGLSGLYELGQDQGRVRCRVGMGEVHACRAPAWLSNIGSMMMQGLLAMIDPFGLRNKLLEVARNGVDGFKAFFGSKAPRA
jgi:hypothetical protein